ncbi:hypothetical protein C8R46DRAFT_1082548 [Mycena filopes]|nr:hypothetical protein C8R46DRAFT_1082548 [Mycena filopes]
MRWASRFEPRDVHSSPTAPSPCRGICAASSPVQPLPFFVDMRALHRIAPHHAPRAQYDATATSVPLPLSLSFLFFLWACPQRCAAPSARISESSRGFCAAPRLPPPLLLFSCGHARTAGLDPRRRRAWLAPPLFLRICSTAPASHGRAATRWAGESSRQISAPMCPATPPRLPTCLLPPHPCLAPDPAPIPPPLARTSELMALPKPLASPLLGESD